MHFPMNFRSYPSLSFAHNPLSFSYSLMSVPTCVATCNTSPVSNITSLSQSTMNNHQEVSPFSPHPQPPIELVQVTDTLEISNSDDDDDDDDIWEQVNKKQKLEQEDKLRHYKNTSNCTLDSHAQVKKCVVEEIISYLSHVATLDWAKLIHDFPSKLHIDFSKRCLQDAKTKKEWDLCFKKRKVTKVWKHFDVLKWWGTDARHKFPLLFPLAIIVLGKPYTNAYQERCFSLASWFDSKLMQCQKAETLQMRCLDAQNRKNVSRMTKLMGSKWEDQPLFKEQKAHTIISYIDQQQELQSIIALDDSTDSDNESCLSVAADITKEMTMAIPLMKLMKLQLQKLCSIPLSIGVNAQLLLA